MTGKSHELSEAHREKFFQFARKWQDLLSLHRWRITPSQLDTKAMAEIKFSGDVSHKYVRLLLGKKWYEPPSDENLELTAIHELCHILLHEYGEICSESPHDLSKKMEAEHEVVHVLEKLLYELWHQNHVELPEKLPVHRSKQRKA
jgi:hypothetical protein